MILDSFSSLGECYKLDLFAYFFERDPANASSSLQPRPAYIFPLETFRHYFGKHPNNIRKSVIGSAEYMAYKARAKARAEERSRPPPPPEMSPVTPNLIDTAAAGTKRGTLDSDPAAGAVQARINACRDEILGSSPGITEDWDRNETLGKVRASLEDVITKQGYTEHGIIHSADGRFPVLNADGLPPAELAWQESPHHGLVICGETHLILAVKAVAPDRSAEQTTFEAANREVQAANREVQAANREVQANKWRISVAKVWMARTALFLIRLFATVIG